jgi:hypothetical protein
MKWLVFVAVLLVALGAWLLTSMPSHKTDAFDARPKVVRDSVDSSWHQQEAKRDTFRVFLRTASADTLGAILRDRARRPPLFIHDTLLADTATTEGDTGSLGPCEVAISCQEARRLVLRDSSSMLLIDSLRGAMVISHAERDSVATACQPRTPWRAAGIGFGVGYVAGLATCVVLR